jgi:di/tricarboxylate transporter
MCYTVFLALSINTKAEVTKKMAIIKNAQTMLLSKVKNGMENRNIKRLLTIILAMLKMLFTLPISWLGIWLNRKVKRNTRIPALVNPKIILTV